ncbi:ribbon-helix-helix protein, CopG family [Acinetobacter piscicola]|uniref:ribbon-helix-helix protein, CopG family n=1 Tax=Acinetobacter piscicola TaxID=2006115 RepID=UPI001020B113|nr:ribbon-helix-helix protein, CopG family [Acinetobacter piscicola]RYL27121.1 ribbon-helix-helix protein, CopG family [Acinetobacter piscicola]
MAKSRTQINEESNAKRGIVNKAFKLHESTVDLVKDLAEKTGISQAQIVTEALKMYEQNLKKP